MQFKDNNQQKLSNLISVDAAVPLDNASYSNKNYYQTLKHYHRPWFLNNSKGIPIFLVNDNYPASLPCLIVINVIFILLIALSFINPIKHGDQNFQKQLNNVNILLLILIDTTFFLTLFLNPGIIGPQDMDCIQDQQKYCTKCNRKVNSQMQHCFTCEICVQNLDHHCDFFGKCIAGKQRFAFYGFITFVFVGFLSILALATTSLNDN